MPFFALLPVVQIALDGITFAGDRGVVYLPLREIAASLKLPLAYDQATKVTSLGNKEWTDWGPSLFDGTRLVPIRSLTKLGASVTWDPETQTSQISLGNQAVQVTVAPKKAIVDKSIQRLKAWQGERLVFETKVSTGKPGHNTPVGDFEALAREKLRYSRKYDNAPMPWSVHVVGDIFIHGYGSVPSYPASHGCIRVPLTGQNPAKWFWNWVDVGTPITIQGQWAGRKKNGSA